jgi:hypothetical protein
VGLYFYRFGHPQKIWTNCDENDGGCEVRGSSELGYSLSECLEGAKGKKATGYNDRPRPGGSGKLGTIFGAVVGHQGYELNCRTKPGLKGGSQHAMQWGRHLHEWG